MHSDTLEGRDLWSRLGMSDLPQRDRISINTERSQYYIWGGIGLVLAFVGAKNVFEDPSHWYSLTLLVLAWCILFAWLAAYRISIDQDVLSYSALLKGTISVSRNDIMSVEILSGRFSHAVIIKPKAGDPIVINTKPFKRSDLQLVLHFLADKIVNRPNLV